MRVEWGTRHFESLRDAFCGHVINVNVAICSDGDEFVTGVHDRQEGVDDGRVFYGQFDRRSTRKVMCNIPEMHTMIVAPACKFQGRHQRRHGTYTGSFCRVPIAAQRDMSGTLGSNYQRAQQNYWTAMLT